MQNQKLKSFIFIGLLILLIGCANVEQRRNLIIPIAFEKTKWFGKDNGLGIETEWEYRPRMARQLVSENSLIGKNQVEIIEMLGKKQNYQDSLDEVKYILEEFSSGADVIAIEYLKITFNIENKVEKAEIEFFKNGKWR